MTITVAQLEPVLSEATAALTALNALIAGNALALASTPSGVLSWGGAYSQANIASGGTAPYAYSVSAGSLPPGTTLNVSTGLVSGALAVIGTFSYTIEATDSSSPALTAPPQTLSGTIVLAPPAGAGALVMEDLFAGPTLNMSNWNGYMGDAQYSFWGDSGALTYPDSSVGNAPGNNAEFAHPSPACNAAYDITEDSTGPHLTTGAINGYGLQLTATPSSKYPAYTWESGYIQGNGKLASFPAAGGFLQILAMLPDVSQGGWPSFWCLNGSVAGDTGEFDIHEGGFIDGSVPVNHTLSTHLFAPGGSQILQDAGVDLTASYNLWTVKYVPGVSLEVWFNGGASPVVGFYAASGTSTATLKYSVSIPTGSMEVLVTMTMATSAVGNHTQIPSPVTQSSLTMNVAAVTIYDL